MENKWWKTSGSQPLLGIKKIQRVTSLLSQRSDSLPFSGTAEFFTAACATMTVQVAAREQAEAAL